MLNQEAMEHLIAEAKGASAGKFRMVLCQRAITFQVTGVVCDDVPPVSTSNCGPAGSFACDERGAEDVIQCAEDRFASVELEGKPFALVISSGRPPSLD